jgi:hypothetical protein
MMGIAALHPSYDSVRAVTPVHYAKYLFSTPR